MNEWISVKELKPSIWVRVLLFEENEYTGAHRVVIGIYLGSGNWHIMQDIWEGFGWHTKYWMALPEPPKEEA